MTRRRRFLVAVGGIYWGRAVQAQPDSLEGLWLSDEGLPNGSWRWTLRKDGPSWQGEVERQAGAITAKRWRLRGTRQGNALRAVLERDAGDPLVQVLVRQVADETLAVTLHWPDGLIERFNLIRP